MLQLQDGTNDLGTVSFTFRTGVPSITFAQNFDSVSAPVLPSGWTNTASGASTGWRTVTAAADTAPNSAFASDPDSVSDSTLTSPVIPISTATAQLTFRHSFDTEEEFDGGVLEIAYNNGPFNDIIDAGGTFVTGGYNLMISDDPQYQSAIQGRDAWTGDSGGFITTIVNLPVTAAGQNVRLRWRMASDESVNAGGWNVDSISLIDNYTCCHGLVPPQIVETRQAGNTTVFSFNTLAGQTYITEYKNTLATNDAWIALQTNAGDGTKKSVTNGVSAATNRFFRVKTQ
jgi:hypothetical protein